MALQAIFDGIDWLGLTYDQGPFYQTKRFDRYSEVCQQLLVEGKAYRCYCSKERLQALRELQMQAKIKPRYDGHCRNIDPTTCDLNAPHVIRFKTPLEGTVRFNDLVCGSIEIANCELDDLVIVRTDKIPTYNFAVVIDDLDMQVTHVIRGVDHITNTPRQINIFLAMDAMPPEFAHIPMILGNDGKRLSKRHGAVSVMQYREDGYLPQALLNYLARLGWSHGNQEIFSMEEMINLFDISQANHAAAAFDINKLNWLPESFAILTTTN